MSSAFTSFEPTYGLQCTVYPEEERVVATLLSVSVCDAQPQTEAALMKTPGGPRWVGSPVRLSAAECGAVEDRKARVQPTGCVRVSRLLDVHYKRRHAAHFIAPGLHRTSQGCTFAYTVVGKLILYEVFA